ncbi:MAG: hypothetical protein H0X41_09645 [Chitinophagaceae bacterium]|nr:hypothetical protein [Chitinophagaceae bacterium]
MRISILFPVIILVGGLVAGCCKAYCPKETMELGFIGFKNTDIDTLLITRYKGRTSFNMKIDSFYTGMWAPQMDTLFYSISEKISLADDYLISGPAFPDTYHISDIKTSSVRCECGGQQVKQVSQFVLNEARFSDEVVYLRK